MGLFRYKLAHHVSVWLHGLLTLHPCSLQAQRRAAEEQRARREAEAEEQLRLEAEEDERERQENEAGERRRKRAEEEEAAWIKHDEEQKAAAAAAAAAQIAGEACFVVMSVLLTNKCVLLYLTLSS